MLQMGFFDLSDRYASLDAKKDPLVEINAVVPWEEFRPALDRVSITKAGDVNFRRAFCQAATVIVRRRMIWNTRGDFGAEVIGSSGSGYAA